MNIGELIESAANSGVFLHLEGEQLGFELSVEVFPEAIKSKIIAHKPEIIAFLSKGSQSTGALVRPKITKVKRDSHCFQLSFAQQRLWFIDKMLSGSAEYNIVSTLKISGSFNLDFSEQIFSQMIQRHEPLRTIYQEENNQPIQLIQEEFNFSIERIDLTSHSLDIQKSMATQLIFDESCKIFDLAKDLMMRAVFITLSDEDNEPQGILVVNTHHIASDGWSMSVIIREFVHQYKAMMEGEEYHFPPLDVQYVDYSTSQRKWLQGDSLSQQTDYWKKQLEQVPAVHSLPLDFPRPEIKHYEGKVVTDKIPYAASQKLLHIVSDKNATLFMVLHAGLSLVFSRHSNTFDIVIGTYVANRLQAELDPLVGFFVNTLMLRTNTNHKTFDRYLDHVREVNLDAQANQDIPVEHLVELTKTSRTMQHNPIFQLVFTMNTNEGGDINLPGIRLSHQKGSQTPAKFDLDVTAEVIDGEIRLTWVYDISIFTQETISRFNRHVITLLENVAENPEVSLDKLSMLSRKEIKYLQGELTSASHEHSPGKQVENCVQLFEKQADKQPDSIALTDDNQRLTYQYVDRAANRISQNLQARGIKKGQLVGVCCNRNIDMVIAILAILKTGAGYVPMDNDTPINRLSYIIEDSKMTLLIMDDCLPAVTLPKKITAIDIAQITQDSEHLPYLPIELVQPYSTDDICYVIYTSGSTGQPKGVSMPHRVLVNFMTSMPFNNEELSKPMKMLQFASPGFDMCFTDIFLTLHSGGELRLISKEIQLDSYALINLLITEKIERINLPYAVLRQIASIAIERGQRLPALKIIISTAEQLFITKEIKAFFIANSQCQLINHYGPSETHVITALSLPKNVALWPVLPSIGKFLPNVHGVVLDHNKQLVPFGAVGLLHIGAFSIADGYLNQQELTQKNFIDNPFKPNERLYNTGDLVRWLPNEELAYLGRNDNQVKIRGFRVELGEIEQQLSSCKEVDSCLVSAVEDEGQTQYLIAYAIPSSKVIANNDRRELLKRQLQNSLPNYMQPTVIIFIEKWPLTLNGKIDKKLLPKPDFSLLHGEYIPASTEAEQKLVVLWADILKLLVSEISVTANFFELGGHSLTIKDIFELQTIKECALHLDYLSARTASELLISTEGDIEASADLEEMEW
jgi:amino acid adenylation domain-containing protein